MLENQENLPPLTLIEPRRSLVDLNMREIWEYRDLIIFLAWRDISVRYKQTLAGVGWAVFQPFLLMIVFSLFFGNLAEIPSNGVPYPIFNYTALLPWQFFATGMSMSSTSLISNANMITKVYFPRLVIPISAILPPLVDFCIAFLMLLAMMLFYHIMPTWNILWLPLFLLLALVSALGVGLWLSAIAVTYRDVRFIVPFFVQLGMFVSPVVYPSNMVPEPWNIIYGINPMAGVIEGFRWALLGTSDPPGLMLVVSAVIALILLVSGLVYFSHVEETFADVV